MTDDAACLEHRLADLAGFASDAAYTVSLGLDAYLDASPNGRVLRNNGRHIIVQIATVVEKLPQSFKDAHPDIEWVQIARMRHLIAHHYDNVNDRLGSWMRGGRTASAPPPGVRRRAPDSAADRCARFRRSREPAHPCSGGDRGSCLAATGRDRTALRRAAVCATGSGGTAAAWGSTGPDPCPAGCRTPCRT